MESHGKAREKFSVDQACEILERTPKVVRSMLDGLSEEWMTGGDESSWAPFDIVGHLIHGELTDWIPRARIILEQGENRTFEPFDRLAQFELSKGKSLPELLDEFEQFRAEGLSTLLSWNLTDEQLRLIGNHPELGEVTLEQLIATWAVHDLTHIRQIATVMARGYEKTVGPWKEYLSILK
jgi:DinB superfamily